jgi:hypothetical protein
LYLTKTNFGSQIALKWICLMEEPYEKNLWIMKESFRRY